MEKDPATALGRLEHLALNDLLVGSSSVVKRAINSEFMRVLHSGKGEKIKKEV